MNGKGKIVTANRGRAPVRRQGCRGQAFTELAAVLIGICVVLLAGIFFSVVGVRNVKNVIAAREEADKNLASGTITVGGKQISHWVNIDGSQGDGLQFTADDSPVQGGGCDGNIFRGELVTTDGHLDLPNLASRETAVYYKSFDLAAANLFLNASQLTGGSAQVLDVMNDKKLYDVKTAMKKFGTGSQIDLHDTVFLPNVYAK
ncbi:MAG: hypothetical protein J6A21_06780 [Lentisphaeria bacterium]|nr:hypothetical protein [Lentisphaeria bacterium]